MPWLFCEVKMTIATVDDDFPYPHLDAPEINDLGGSDEPTAAIPF